MRNVIRVMLISSISIVLLAVVMACEKPAVRTQQTNNPDMDLELLFENEGCKVWRFDDNNRSHYYTDFRGETITTKTESCGKNCVKQVDENNHTVR